jgi:preprotein translocase subunit SecD
VFKNGADGIDAFNEAALLCWVSNPDPTVCPSARLAIVLDHRVVASPTINAPTFSRDEIQISGAFDEDEAKDLAAVLRFGALPVELETQQTRTVSATIGDDVLRAGIASGLVGLALVTIYLLAYYRLAGLVAIVGLALSGALLWAIIAWFGENLGLALTLAGVVGLIVSVGVSADSNIVYFENVKDAYLAGRKIPTAVERAYHSSISTIVKADVVSLIAAALLYWLTVGAVRGFAFYLGLATLLDLVISWLFMRPALGFLARRQVVVNRPSLLGLPSGGSS